ncbi:Uncharacterised protein [Salmonella enterica subsp. indica]|uniref:Uncharacterized protein n=1 Tax=Salmonella enterica subsp. indica TaxID=59207 RepID=A0A379YM93_SALER|nr:Uncharacterised protein [Salmonella enterica subsp. indica]
MVKFLTLSVNWFIHDMYFTRSLHLERVVAVSTTISFISGVSLDIENYCTVGLFFEQVMPSQ